MSSRILGFAGVLAMLMATPVVAYTSAAPPTVHPAASERRHAGFRIPKELKMLWKREEHARLKAMPREQRRGWLRARWTAMSDQQKQAKMAELQKKWDSLPESVRQRMLERSRERREARRMHREQGGTKPDSPHAMQQN